MAKGQERATREKKKPKKEKGAKQPSAYASQYGNQAPQAPIGNPGKKN